MALNVVLPELLLPPPMVIVILPLMPRYHSRVLPAARLRKIDLHCVMMPSPTAAMLYQVVKYSSQCYGAIQSNPLSSVGLAQAVPPSHSSRYWSSFRLSTH